MSWIDDVIAGTDIVPAWGNAIRDRTVTPFASRTERASQLPSPSPGMVTWIADEHIAEFWDGSQWEAPAQAVPIGAVVPYFTEAEPSGTTWRICNGQALSRATFDALFALLGTDYGVGDGSTTFNIPDLRNRFLYGLAAGGVLNSAQVGGEATHTLTAAELPDHDHTAVDGNVFVVSIGGTQAHRIGLASELTGPYVTFTSVDAGTETNNAAHQNLPPYMRANFIMRVK